MTKPYPQWICAKCGAKYGRCAVSVATWHQDKCDVCGKLGSVTEPRDYGHLLEGWQDEKVSNESKPVDKVPFKPWGAV